MIVVRIRNVSMLIEGDIPKDIRDQIRSKMSYVVPGFKFTPRYKKEQFLFKKGLMEDGKIPWDGTTTVAKYDAGNIRAPVGLFSYLKEVFEENSIEYITKDERLPAVRSQGWSTEGLELRDYQRDINQTILKKERGIMKAATGSGKSEIMIKTIVDAGCFPAIFYVTSCDLLEQTYDRFMKYVRYNGQPVEIGRIGAGHCDLQPITIATVQSAEVALADKFTPYDADSKKDKTKLSDNQKKEVIRFLKEAQFVTVDECQHCSCQTIQTVMGQSYKARLRIGCSASPWRDDGLDILIEACFGKRLCDIDASFLIDNGYLIQPYIIFNHFKLDYGENDNFNSHYKAYVTECEPRNKWVAEKAIHHVGQNRSTIVLVKWAAHANTLKNLIPGSEVLTASGDNKKTPKKRKEVLNRLRSKETMCVIGTTLLDEGIDVPSAEVGIFAGGGKSSTRALQRVGRFIRKDPNNPDKTRAIIEEIFDHTVYLSWHAKARREIMETERNFEIIDNRSTMSVIE